METLWSQKTIDQVIQFLASCFNELDCYQQCELKAKPSLDMHENHPACFNGKERQAGNSDKRGCNPADHDSYSVG